MVCDKKVTSQKQDGNLHNVDWVSRKKPTTLESLIQSQFWEMEIVFLADV
jgi:hypothetical protein